MIVPDSIAESSLREPRRDGVRMALREGTAAAHERLHHLPPFQALGAGRLSRTGYVALLRRLLGFHRAVERQVAAAELALRAHGVVLEERKRSPLLLADLASLGAPVGSEEAVAEPQLPEFADAARALGCLYVTEGSTLGGRLLARALDPLLGPPEVSAGRSFLLGHGARHGAMWQALCAALERCGTDLEERAAMSQAATEAFAAFEAWFTAPGWFLDEPPAAA
jgi:heme oxygenase